MRRIHWVLALGLMSAAPPLLAAEKTTIRLATVVPRDSNWHDILRDMGEKWRQASGGLVQVRVIAGTLGDEPELIRRMRIGQIDAAAVSTVGLGSIDLATQAMHIPLAFQSLDEMAHVLDQLAPELEKVMEERGFVVLNWVEVGWVYFFTTAPVEHPDDLRNLRMFVWNTDAKSPEIWKSAGFRPVPLSTTDILPSLQTGMIHSVTAPPVIHLANQWFALTGYMTDMAWAPLSGATIVNRSAWEKIPVELRPRLKQIARETGEALRSEARRLERDAIRAMTERGLTVVALSPEARREWQELAEAQYPKIRGDLIPAEYFDQVIRLRDEHRAATHLPSGP
jgi:TRAP-type transport system periplasmic protein